MTISRRAIKRAIFSLFQLTEEGTKRPTKETRSGKEARMQRQNKSQRDFYFPPSLLFVCTREAPRKTNRQRSVRFLCFLLYGISPCLADQSFIRARILSVTDSALNRRQRSSARQLLGLFYRIVKERSAQIRNTLKYPNKKT